MTCPECGQEVEPGAAYCLNNECGALLPTAVSAPAGEPAGSAVSPAQAAATGDPGDADAPPPPPATRPPVPGGTDAPSATSAVDEAPAGAPGDDGPRPVTVSGDGPADPPRPKLPLNRLLPAGAAVLVLVLVGSIGLLTWDRTDPAGPPAPLVPIPGAEAATRAPADLLAPPTVAAPTTSTTPTTATTPTGTPTSPRRKPTAGGGGTTPATQPKPTTQRTTTAPAKPAPTTPTRTSASTSSGKPYLTASARAFCRDGWTWAVTITGQLHNASAGYDPIGWVYHPDTKESYGYDINGDGTTRFSGTVPPNWGGEHELYYSSTTWELTVTLKNGTELSASGTARNPC